MEGTLHGVAHSLPARPGRGPPLEDVGVDGRRGWFLMDTDGRGSVDFMKTWADAHAATYPCTLSVNTSRVRRRIDSLTPRTYSVTNGQNDLAA
jgi:hypothetical protein